MFRKVFTLVLAAGFIFGGCTKDDDEPVSGSFNGTVKATVEDGNSTGVNLVRAVIDPAINTSTGNLTGTPLGESVDFIDGGFSISLSTPGSATLKDVTVFFDSFMNASDKGNLDISNPEARVTDVDFIGFYNNGYLGRFRHATSDKKTTCLFVYVNSDVTITGGKNISVSLKQGWNRVYISTGMTTKEPKGMKWHYEAF